MNSETIVSDSDAFEASFRNWFWSDQRKDSDATDIVEDALAQDLVDEEKVGDEAPIVDVALPNDVVVTDQQAEDNPDKTGFLFTETIYIEGEVMDSPAEETPPPTNSNDVDEEASTDNNAEPESESEEDDKSVRSITDIIETSLTSGRELRRSYVRYHYSSDEDDFLKTSSSSESEQSNSDQDEKNERRGRGRGRPSKGTPSSRPPNSRRCPQDRQTEEELVEQIAQETNKRFVCRSCFKSFAYKKCLRNHYESQHPDWLNGPDEEHLLRKVTVTRRKKHQSSDEEIPKVEEKPHKPVSETQPIKDPGHDYQSPGRAAPFVKNVEPVSESIVSVPTNEPNLPEPNAAAYSITVTVKGPPSFIKTYSRTKVLTDSIEKILQSPVTSPKNIMIVPSSNCSHVSDERLSKVTAEMKKVELAKEKVVVDTVTNVNTADEISQEYCVENGDVEIIYPEEELIYPSEELIYPSEEVIYPSEEVLVDDMTSLIVDNFVEDIPYVCNEIVVETEEEFVLGGNLVVLDESGSVENPETKEAVETPDTTEFVENLGTILVESPDTKEATDDPEASDVPKRQPVVCLERLGDDIVEKFVTQRVLRPRSQLLQRVIPKEKLMGGVSESQRKLRCNVCGWRFKHSYHLTVHSLTHTKSAQFDCQQCHGKFFSKRSYDCHLSKCKVKMKIESSVDNTANASEKIIANCGTKELSVVTSAEPEKIIANCGTKELSVVTSAEPLKTIGGEEVVSEEIPVVLDTSQSVVTERRVTRQSLTHIQQDKKIKIQRKRRLLSNKDTCERKIKRKKIETSAESNVAGDTLVVCNGDSVKDGSTFNAEGSLNSESLPNDSVGTVRKSKRRGASSGAGYYFWMHHGQFQRDVCFHHPHTNVSKRRKLNGIHASSKQTHTVTKSNVRKECVAEIKVVDPEVEERKDGSLTEGGDNDSEIVLRLEDMDEVGVDKMDVNADVVATDDLLVEENCVVPLVQNDIETVIVNSAEEVNSEDVPIGDEKETLVPICDIEVKGDRDILTDVTNLVVTVDTSDETPNVEGGCQHVDGDFETDEKSLQLSDAAVELKTVLKRSDSSELSVANSDLLPSSIVDTDKVDDLEMINEEIETHNDLDLQLLGIRTDKSVTHLDNADTNSDGQLGSCAETIKSDDLTSSFESSEKRELLLASDTDELNDSAKSEISLPPSSNVPSPTTATVTESSPTTATRRKMEAGYYSWLNGEQFSRRKSWSSSDASGSGRSQCKSDTKEKTHVCQTCMKEFKYFSNLRAHRERHQLCKVQGKVLPERQVKRKAAAETSVPKDKSSTKRKANLELKVKAALKNPQISITEKKKYLKFLSRNAALSATTSKEAELKRELKSRVIKSFRSADLKKSSRDVMLSKEVRSQDTKLSRVKKSPDYKLPSIKKNESKSPSTKKAQSPNVRKSQELKLGKQSKNQDVKLPKERKNLVMKSPKNVTMFDSKFSAKKRDARSAKHTNTRDQLKSEKDKRCVHSQNQDKNLVKHKFTKQQTAAVGRGRDGPKGQEVSSVRFTSKQLDGQVNPTRKMSNIKTYARKPKREEGSSKPLAKLHSVDDDLAKDRKQGYQCKFCDHVFQHYFSWRYHIAMDHGTQTVCCPLCQKWQHLQNDTLEQHLQTHFRSEQFVNQAIVQRLVLLLIERKPLPNLEPLGIYFCHWCNTAFGSRLSLEKHQRQELMNKPHQCPLCGRRFADILQVEPHILSHAQTDSYRCKWCDKLFSDVKSLEFHEEHHSKNFKCEVCQKNFKSLGFLRRHKTQRCGLQNPPTVKGQTQDANALPTSCSNVISDCSPASSVPPRTSNLFDVFGEALSALRSQSHTQEHIAHSKNNLDMKPSSSGSIMKTKVISSVVKKQCINELAASGKKSALT